MAVGQGVASGLVLRRAILLLAAVLLVFTLAGPAAAADRKAPKIVGAQMQDADRDGHADRVSLTCAERVRRARHCVRTNGSS